MNIQNSIRLLTDAATVDASTHLPSEDKIALLTELAGSVFSDMPGCPAHATIVRASIERMIEYERNTGPRAAAEAKEQGREAEGFPEPTEVAAGRAEEGPEAPPWKASGSEADTADAGRADSASSAPEAPRAPKASSKAKKP